MLQTIFPSPIRIFPKAIRRSGFSPLTLAAAKILLLRFVLLSSFHPWRIFPSSSPHRCWRDQFLRDGEGKAAARILVVGLVGLPSFASASSSGSLSSFFLGDHNSFISIAQSSTPYPSQQSASISADHQPIDEVIASAL